MSTLTVATVRRIIKNAGLPVAARRPSRIKGLQEHSRGYLVATHHGGGVEVRWSAGLAHSSNNTRLERLNEVEPALRHAGLMVDRRHTSLMLTRRSG